MLMQEFIKKQNIQFQVLYSIKKTKNDILNEVREQGGIVLEKNTPDGSISYKVEKENVVYLNDRKFEDTFISESVSES